MAKKRMINIDDLLEKENLSNENNDMIFVSANNEVEPTKSEQQVMSRLDRIRSAAVDVEEPLFDGITDLDLGTVTIGNENDISEIRRRKQQIKTEKLNDSMRDSIISEMNGVEAQDVVEDFGLDVDTAPMRDINQENLPSKKVNSSAVQEILENLHKER